MSVDEAGGFLGILRPLVKAGAFIFLIGLLVLGVDSGIKDAILLILGVLLRTPLKDGINTALSYIQESRP